MRETKKIAVFSMSPLFPEFSMGGGQAQLKKLALYLGEAGHQLTIFATRHEASCQPFHWHENVEIRPILRFKQPFPEPYLTPLYHISNALRYLGAGFAAADTIYSHDGGLLLPYAYQDKPTVISLRSIIYPETMLTAFLFQGDELILSSEHSRAAYTATVGQFAPEIDDYSHVIHNGFDWDVFRYSPPEAIFELVPPEVQGHPTLLFPHRPEVSKGIYEVVQLARKLVYDCGFQDLRVLVPGWVDADKAPYKNYYGQLRRAIREAGLGDVFVFHDWVNEALLAEYYSLGDLTLSIGSCVETFGNTPFESLGCGTPALVARVATYRDLLPDAHIERVDYGDIDAAVAIAAAILCEGRRAPAATLDYLRANFSLEAMGARYAEVILKARKRPPLRHKMPQLQPATRYQLAPWCYVSPKRGIYNDFRNRYHRDEALIRLTQSQPEGFSAEAVAAARLQAWLDDGYIVPLPVHKG